MNVYIYLDSSVISINMKQERQGKWIIVSLSSGEVLSGYFKIHLFKKSAFVWVRNVDHNISLAASSSPIL